MKGPSDHNVRDGSFSSRIACAVYSKAAFPLFRTISAINPLVVYYHIVSDKDVPHVKNLYQFRSVSQFKRDLDVFLRLFRPVSLQDFLASLEEKQALASGSFMLTFDDGLKECYEVVAPILKLNGIPATFFLCSAFVDNKELAYDHKKSLLSGLLRSRRLSSAQDSQIRAVLEEVGIVEPSLVSALLSVDYHRKHVLDQIAALLEYDFSAYLKTVQPYLTSEQVIGLVKMGHAIGAHSIDHPRYADLPLTEQVHQTLESVRFVKERFSLTYGAFSFPHSDANISREFFRETFTSGDVDVCFGNQGLMEDSEARNVQRSSMEKTSLPAEAVLGRGYARCFLKAATGGRVVKRT
jgi:peptidoglycan/xylan/chitin deacetylase (PgdA/CDA1 family)